MHVEAVPASTRFGLAASARSTSGASRSPRARACSLAATADIEPEVEDLPIFEPEVLYYGRFYKDGRPGTLHGFFWARAGLREQELSFAGGRLEIRFRRIWGVRPRRRRR